MTEKVYVIHENEEWTVHLFRRLEELRVPYEDWFTDTGSIDLTSEPPKGVFYNRMSASSHTRGHRFAPEMAEAKIAWLERNGRRVVNGSQALRLEVSKVNQYMALDAVGIRTPKTIAVNGKEQLLAAATAFEGESFITKHNRAGKGLGVRLFHSIEALREYVEGEEFDASVDGITLLQQYIQADEAFITRCEFVGGKFLYAVRVDTSEGFELCPADACRLEDVFCPADGASETRPKFQIVEGFDDPIIAKYERFLEENGIEVAGIEFIQNAQGELFTYDVNTNTNYNADAEAASGTYGMLELAKYLDKLRQQDRAFV
ncbi:alpha-L-glutamate ligase [Planococcus sp. ISL-109]|uniref:ATP-grasp domain-containing protein n=1 Tax=Planococcus sp. ISL-109 TaxID=2819166 RepID=UPI001BE5B50D|nr:alpha-L-glutamate ligase [Planococcus sp. ISL-109]MBT2581424.1 alpha-L-glutamate ligase [Planococcus sp. ISL-109]